MSPADARSARRLTKAPDQAWAPGGRSASRDWGAEQMHIPDAVGEAIVVEEGADLREVFSALAEQAPDDWPRWQFFLSESLDHIKQQITENSINSPEEQVKLSGVRNTVRAIGAALSSLPQLAPHLGYLELLEIELAKLLAGTRSEVIAPVSRNKRGRPRSSTVFSVRVGRVGAAVEIMRPWCQTISEAAQFVSGLLKIEARKGQPILGWQGNELSLSSVEDWHSKCMSKQIDRHTKAVFNSTRAFAEDYFFCTQNRANAEEAVRWLLSGADRPPDLKPQGQISG